MVHKPILCMDFDGVIHSYTSGWKGIDKIPDPPVNGALEFLPEAMNYFNVCIYSSRSKEDAGVLAMQNWLNKHLCPGRKPINSDWWTHIEFPIQKPSAFLTIDDRAIQFDGTFPPPRTLLNFKPWNKK